MKQHSRLSSEVECDVVPMSLQILDFEEKKMQKMVYLKNQSSSAFHYFTIKALGIQETENQRRN